MPRRDDAAPPAGPETGLAPIPPRPAPNPPPTALPLDEKPWLGTRELARLLDVYPLSIRNWRRAGLLPNTVQTAGGHYTHAREDVLRLLRARVPYNSRGVYYTPTRQRLVNEPLPAPRPGPAGIIKALREQGCTWAGVAKFLGVSVSTARRLSGSAIALR